MVDYTRGSHRHFPKKFFARGEKLTAGSVSLSDWLGTPLADEFVTVALVE